MKDMAYRIQTMRSTLRESLENLDCSLSWEHITKQIGMFSLLGISPDQVKQLERDFHIYMTPDGRIRYASKTNKKI